ncbi:hypothetical protein SLS64_006249 [Diaporthe eres]|uniref:Sedlin n=1 Tax=Diaporthe eres TaxID=83184 RepID=A0ABR1NQQ0_DIAER
MATAIPSIACLGVIGRNNNPLHISIFPSHDPATNTLKPIRTPLQFSLLLSSTLDIFDLRAKHSAVGGGGATSGGGGGGAGSLSGDYGLLHAVDERLAAYGYETNTGVKFVVVVDMRGRRIDSAALHSSSSSTSGAAGGGGGSNNASSEDAKGSGGGGDGGGISAAARRGAAVVGLREGDMKPVFRAMQTAYVRLLQNPFYEPDEHAPLTGHGGKRIVSRRFGADMRRIGEGWTVGVTSL